MEKTEIRDHVTGVLLGYADGIHVDAVVPELEKRAVRQMRLMAHMLIEGADAILENFQLRAQLQHAEDKYGKLLMDSIHQSEVSAFNMVKVAIAASRMSPK